MVELKDLLWESRLAIALVALILSRSIDVVLYTRITYEYKQFLWYFSNIITPISFLVIATPIVWYKLRFTDDISPAMRAFPHYKFIIMALFDTLSTLLMTFPVPHIGGNLANVLSQLILPVNMLLAYFFLSTHFQRVHFLGAILVLYGGLVAMFPVIQGEASSNMPDPTAFWITLALMSLVPSAASNVYKEIGLKGVELDIWYANTWISVYQTLLGFASIWTIRIPAFCDPPIAWKDFPDYLVQAQTCFAGSDVTLNDQNVVCDSGVFQVFVFYMFFNVFYNQLMLYIFKQGSSVLFVVTSAVCLPLTDLLYTIPLFAGTFAAQTFTNYDAFAMVVLVVGLLVYHSEKEEEETRDHKLIEKSPMFASPTLQSTHWMKLRKNKVIYRHSPVVYRSGNVRSLRIKALLRDAKLKHNNYGAIRPMSHSTDENEHLGMV